MTIVLIVGVRRSAIKLAAEETERPGMTSNFSAECRTLFRGMSRVYSQSTRKPPSSEIHMSELAYDIAIQLRSGIRTLGLIFVNSNPNP